MPSRSSVDALAVDTIPRSRSSSVPTPTSWCPAPRVSGTSSSFPSRACRMLSGPAIDEALAAMGDFADTAAPALTGHSEAVARLTQEAAKRMGFDAAAQRGVTRAARVHDLGRVAVSPAGVKGRSHSPPTNASSAPSRVSHRATAGILPVPRRTGGDRVRAPRAVRRHRLPPGRRCRGAVPGGRLLAAADAYHTMTEPRPQPALSSTDAASALRNQSREGRLDADAVRAVLDASGQAAPPHPPRWSDRPRGAGPRSAGPRVPDQTDRPQARNLHQDRQSARAEYHPRSASRPGPPPPSSRWSTAWPDGAYARWWATDRTLASKIQPPRGH